MDSITIAAKKYAKAYETKLERVVAEEAYIDSAHRVATPEEIERVAKAIYEYDSIVGWYDSIVGWDEVLESEPTRRDCLRRAKAALRAQGREVPTK